MTLGDWIPALSTSALTIIGFAITIYYRAKVERTVQHNLDRKLEELRAKLRGDEETLKANLREKDRQIDALRTGALSGMANRQAALDKRRLEAIEKLRAAVIDQSQFKGLLKMIALLNMDRALDGAAKQDKEGEKLRKFAEFIWTAHGLDNSKVRESPDKDRPFVPPVPWALFTAYRQILSYSAAQVHAMRYGMGRDILDPKPMLELLKTALPSRADYVDQHTTRGLSFLIDELEEKLLVAIVESLDGAASDEKSIRQAADILKAADAAAAAAKPTLDIPDDMSGFRADAAAPAQS